MLHLSPTLTNEIKSGLKMNSVRPEYIDKCWSSGIYLGGRPSTAFLTALIKEGSVPQHPPTMFTKPSKAKLLIT